MVHYEALNGYVKYPEGIIIYCIPIDTISTTVACVCECMCVCKMNRIAKIIFVLDQQILFIMTRDETKCKLNCKTLVFYLTSNRIINDFYPKKNNVYEKLILENQSPIHQCEFIFEEIHKKFFK